MKNGFYMIDDSTWELCSTPNETVMMTVILRLWSMNKNKPFKTKNDVMSNMCKMSRETVKRTKQSLKDKGLIDYKSSEGKMTEYTVVQRESEEKKISTKAQKTFENKNKNSIINNKSESEKENRWEPSNTQIKEKRW